MKLYIAIIKQNVLTVRCIRIQHIWNWIIQQQNREDVFSLEKTPTLVTQQKLVDLNIVYVENIYNLPDRNKTSFVNIIKTYNQVMNFNINGIKY